MFNCPLRGADWDSKITQRCTLLPDGSANPQEKKENVEWALDFYKQFKYTKGHIGIDYAAPLGTPVHAPFDCTVVVKDHKTGYGLHVICIGMVREKSNDRLVIRTAHLSEVSVKTGDYINCGDQFGKTGKSGTPAAHLHIDMQKATVDKKILSPNDGTWGRLYIDPLKYIIYSK